MGLFKLMHLYISCRYDCIENDLLGSLEFGNHNIAPYKSKGIERASELIACWKANNSDKYLASDHGTSGKMDTSGPFLLSVWYILVEGYELWHMECATIS